MFNVEISKNLTSISWIQYCYYNVFQNCVSLFIGHSNSFGEFWKKKFNEKV